MRQFHTVRLPTGNSPPLLEPTTHLGSARGATRILALGLLLACVCAPTGVARAAEADAAATETPGEPLAYDSTTSIAITATALGTALLADTVFKSTLAPPHCRWCEPTALDRRVRSGLVWDHPLGANVASWFTVPATAVVGYGGLFWASDGQRFWEDAVMLSEATSLVWLTTSIAKYAAGRQRPALRFSSQAADDFKKNDVNLSFFSQHTSLAFALAVGAGTIATQRGYARAPWIWGSGLTLAAVTAWLRVAADAHYATDVLTGAVVGSLGGALVPLLLHPRTGEGETAGAQLQLAPWLDGASGLRIAGVF